MLVLKTNVSTLFNNTILKLVSEFIYLYMYSPIPSNSVHLSFHRQNKIITNNLLDYNFITKD